MDKTKIQSQEPKTMNSRNAQVTENDFHTLAMISLFCGLGIGVFLPIVAAVAPWMLWGGSAVKPIFAIALLGFLVPAGVIFPLVMIILAIRSRVKNGRLTSNTLDVILYMLGIAFCQLPFLIWMCHDPL